MEEEQFAQYVRRYSDTIYRVAFHSCKNAADSQDIVQNVLLKLYREQKEFESEEHVRRWVIRVAVNESKKLLCSAWFRKSVPLEEYAQTLELEEPEESTLFLSVMSLPKKYRVPVYLYYYEEYSVREISSLLHTKESTVATCLERARKKLRAALCPEQKEQTGE